MHVFRPLLYTENLLDVQFFFPTEKEVRGNIMSVSSSPHPFPVVFLTAASTDPWLGAKCRVSSLISLLFFSSGKSESGCAFFLRVFFASLVSISCVVPEEQNKLGVCYVGSRTRSCCSGNETLPESNRDAGKEIKK